MLVLRDTHSIIGGNWRHLNAKHGMEVGIKAGMKSIRMCVNLSEYV